MKTLLAALFIIGGLAWLIAGAEAQTMERYYLCSSSQGNTSVMRPEGATCSPKEIRQELRQNLQSGYRYEFKKYNFGTQKEADREAREAYKHYYCRWVDLLIKNEE
jgi:hypothetical protein